MNLSPHFTLEELTRTGTGLNNEPSEEHITALTALCVHVLEPMRAEFGPIRVSSGYRSTAVSLAVGSSKKSQHGKGEAADIQPMAAHVTRDMLFGWALGRGLPFDQLITYEDKPHLHVSFTLHRNNRGSVLVKDPTGYHRFRPNG